MRTLVVIFGIAILSGAVSVEFFHEQHRQSTEETLPKEAKESVLVIQDKRKEFVIENSSILSIPYKYILFYKFTKEGLTLPSKELFVLYRSLLL